MPNMLSHAVKLLNKGYIPLRVASGTKAAKNPGWSSEIPTDISVHRDFARDSNLGVRCGDTHPDGTCLLAIDVDVDDAELFRCVEHAIGDKTVPVKRGKKGGTYFVRLDYEQKSCKIQLVRDGKKVNAIDVLCKGAQTVVPPSVHPDTSLPYRWIAGQQLQDVDYRALPVFGQALLDEIRGFCKDPSDPIVALNDMEWRGIGGGGNTHDVCVRAVASMVSRKWADEDIHQRIQRAKRVACEAAAMPFNWPESQKVIQEWIESSRAKGFGAPPRKQKRPSHGSIADAFFPQAINHFLFDRERGCWYFFDGICWRSQNDFRLRNAIDLFMSAELRDSQIISGVERSLRDRPDFTMRQGDWDPDPQLLNTPAGTVDLKTGDLRGADPADLITRCTAVSPASSCDGALWVTKVAEWIGEDSLELGYFQKLAGLFLAGGNPEACLLLWIGPGGDGKSVITNTFRHILGDYARTSTDTAFLDTRQSQHHEEIAWLVGARLVLVNEVNGSLPWNDARIKAVTGGESQSASFKGGHLFEYQPEYKLLITGNEPPSLRSVGPEFRRRFHVLKFTRGVANPDAHLPEKLRAEAGLILRWMIDGAVRYFNEGLEPSPAVKAATVEYFEENDTIQQWLDERAILGVDFVEKGALAYGDYQEWAHQQGFSHPLTRNKFSSKLKAKGILSATHHYVGENNSVRCYLGVKLRDQPLF
jgi:P4 family phage/plasmid primase-like protien